MFKFLKSFFVRQVVTAEFGAVAHASAGAQSPVITGVGGGVSITAGIPEKVVDYLMERIRILEAGQDQTQRQDFEFNEKQKLLEELKQKYRELEQRLGQDASGNNLAEQSRELLRQGKVAEAGGALDQLISQTGQNLASHHFSRAQIFELEFRPVQALPHYLEACRLEPANLEYVCSCALLLQKQNEFSKADLLYQEVLKSNRELAGGNPDAYLPIVAATLNNLGVLYRDTQRLEQAGKAYEEALKIYRQLAEDNPSAHLADVAMTLNNVGVLCSDTQRLEQAGKAYEDVLKINRKLAGGNPAAYLSYVAGTLNNLGILYRDTQRLEQAGAAYEEALTIYRELVEGNPAAYLPYEAMTLNNQGNLYGDTQRLEQA